MTKITKFMLLACATFFAFATLFHSVLEIYWGYIYELDRNTLVALGDLWQIFDLVRNPEWFYKCYGNQSLLRGSCDLIFLTASTSVFFITWKRACSKLRDPFVSNLFVDFFETIPQSRFVAVASVLLLNFFFLFQTLDSLSDCRYYGLKDLAYTLDGAGAYELGEQVFSFSANGGGMSLASSCGRTGHDSDRFEIESGRLNQTVAKIYGEHSAEMGRRQAVLANHLESNFDDLTGSEKARKESINIYDELGNLRMKAENLAFLACTQAFSNHFDDARRSTNEALDAVRKYGDNSVERANVVDLVYPALVHMGDKERADQLRTTLNYIQTEPNPSHNFVCIAILFMMSAVTATKLPGVLLTLLGSYWLKRTKFAASDEAKSFWLRKLINLELLRHNYKVADELSRRLLTIAESG